MKITKKLLPILLAVMLLLPASLAVIAADEPTVLLRIEGINENFFFAEVPLGDCKTVIDVVISADKANDNLTVVGAETAYITDINGEAAGKFGGWDGWMYRVNNTEPSVGMGEYTVAQGDEIIIYYSDAYGVGMQYPEMDASNIANGEIKFTSKDITYDADFNPTASVNPVSDMKVVIDGKEYVTDKDGKIQIDIANLAPGEYKVSVSKTAENGAPLVLRLAPDVSVSIPEPTPDETENNPNNENQGDNDKPFNPAFLIPVFAAVIIAVGGALVAVKKKK